MNFKNALCLIHIVIFIYAWTSGQCQKDKLWKVHPPIFEKGPEGGIDEISVKDPSIVFFNDAWHLFYTARSKNQYTTAYVSAAKLNALNTSRRNELSQIRGKTRYGCAPQIFYFTPQEKWYLIYQNKDANYQPAFSTNIDIANPELWTDYDLLLPKDEDRKWIDFWVIAHEETVYLFYTVAHGGVVVRTTTLSEFPKGWGEGKMIFENVHEAVHVYKVKDIDEFHMFYESNDKGVRSFGLAKSKELDSGWEKVSDNYASGDQLVYDPGTNKWTEMVSHGELIRTSYDERMEFEPQNCRWLIQGIKKDEIVDHYPSLPWRIGIIENLRN